MAGEQLLLQACSCKGSRAVCATLPAASSCQHVSLPWRCPACLPVPPQQPSATLNSFFNRKATVLIPVSAEQPIVCNVCWQCEHQGMSSRVYPRHRLGGGCLAGLALTPSLQTCLPSCLPVGGFTCRAVAGVLCTSHTQHSRVNCMNGFVDCRQLANHELAVIHVQSGPCCTR